MVTLNAHFDGKAIIPDEPTNLPVGARLRVTIESVDRVSPKAPKEFELPLLKSVDPDIVRTVIADPEFNIQNAKLDKLLRSSSSGSS